MADRVRTVFVDAPGAVDEALRAVDADPVGIDVERADGARYHRRAALVQVGAGTDCVLLDPVALPDLGGLAAFLEERLAVLHALENDLEPLAACGVRPTRVADTAVAAGLLGLPTGLGDLLAAALDVELDADKEAFQRADWEQRPLTDGMAAYAAGDVVHLPALWERLRARLEEAGRWHWYEQELEAAVERAFASTRDWRRVKGSGRLSPRERARLRAVWEAREALAREHDIAPNRLVHDDVLRRLAVEPPADAEELVRRSPRRRRQLRRHAPVLLEALAAGEHTEEEPRRAGGRLTAADRQRHDALRRRRAEVAEELGVDAGLLCSAKVLWAAVAGAPTTGRELCELAGLRPWQTEVLAGPLWEAWHEVDDAPEDEPAEAASDDER